MRPEPPNETPPAERLTEPTSPAPGARLRIGAWVLYDLANTVYAAIITFVFTPYATSVFAGEQKSIGLVQFASMIVAAVLVPALGALADQTARTRSYLTVATLLCIAAMAGFGLDWGSAFLLTCFFAANLTYNLGLLFYNTLLTSVATDDRVGRVSGLGVGLGYLGTIVVLVALVLPGLPPATTFWTAAALFLGAALPCLVLVRDQRAPRHGRSADAIRAAHSELRRTLRELPRHRDLLWFLLGNFFLADVLNTAILFFANFTIGVFEEALAAGTVQLAGMTFQGDSGAVALKVTMGLCLNGLALPFGILIGRWTDRAPLQALRASGFALLFALGGGAWFGGTSALGYLFSLGVLGAFGLAGVWTAGRKVLVLLAPRARIGQYFGLYGITTKLSVLGCLAYGFVADTFGHKAAMLAQAVPLLIALICLAKVRMPATETTATPA